MSESAEEKRLKKNENQRALTRDRGDYYTNRKLKADEEKEFQMKWSTTPL